MHTCFGILVDGDEHTLLSHFVPAEFMRIDVQIFVGSCWILSLFVLFLRLIIVRNSHLYIIKQLELISIISWNVIIESLNHSLGFSCFFACFIASMIWFLSSGLFIVLYLLAQSIRFSYGLSFEWAIADWSMLSEYSKASTKVRASGLNSARSCSLFLLKS